MKKAYIVIGAGYGDEGKGKTVDYLCDLHKDAHVINIRYNGGAQAGHTVHYENGASHVYSHLGSGTNTGAHTWLSEEFLVDPVAFKKEMRELEDLGVLEPLVFCHPDARIVTPYDIILNRARAAMHTTCGSGIFETIQRHKLIPMTYRDFAEVSYTTLRKKMADIEQYMEDELEKLKVTVPVAQMKTLEEQFMNSLFYMLDRVSFCELQPLVKDNTVLVFEGAQGLLLSEKHGVMPYCTPSDPGSSIPAAYCNSIGVTATDIVYVTRAYATRHGAGPLPGEEVISEELINHTGETNVMNTHQGPFRKSWNLQAAFKAIEMDYQMFAEVIDPKIGVAVGAMITCLDQVSADVRNDTLAHIIDELQLDYYYLSMGPSRRHTVLVGG